MHVRGTGELNVQEWGGGGPGQNLTLGAHRIGQLELFSIAFSCHHAPGPAFHASFWRPEALLAGHAAGAIASNLAGTATTYATAGDRRLLAVSAMTSSQQGAAMTGALDRLLSGPPARNLRFTAQPDEIVEGFIADELAVVVPGAVVEHGPEPRLGATNNSDSRAPASAPPPPPPPALVDNGKLVPLLWEALRELGTEVKALRRTVARLEQQQRQH
jgi:hypothetical protein